MSVEGDLALPERQALAGRDANLLLHDVDTGDELGDRVLDLQARVRLHEVEPGLVVHEELEGSRVGVLHGLGRVDNQVPELATLLLGERRRRRFLEQLLMPPLDRALTLPEVHDRAMVVAKHLDLDVPRVLEILLDIHVRDAERRFRLALCRLDRVAQLLRVPHDAHAAAASARRRLHDDREAAPGGKLQRRFFVLDRTVGAGQQRQACLLHGTARAGLVAHQTNHLGIGSDEANMAGLADLREVRRFGEEAITGMNGVGPRDFRGADNRRNVQIALGAPRRPDTHVFIGKPDVQRVLVGFRIHRHGLDAELAARDDDAHGDLTAVRNQDFFEHAWLRGPNETHSHLDGEQPLAVLNGLSVLDVDLRNLTIVLRLDLVHQLHRFDDAQNLTLFHRVAHIDKRGGARLR